eukprot:CAMPEP_0201873298 /NCGR_PEP_ID=MMETSP0902-20130614/5845_1 /ASSEMBLY_ACC=CAM_ASM_000551 /TAXON_ID=420261 /ORGANISM="Thalassiosira antarctica, Strain CCMP982" /LENGTH=251 /DNA_ID=CAMNT_0048399861 /DNA_START=93 /DNA_END=848 /DNA_ORIENTATION=-
MTANESDDTARQPHAHIQPSSRSNSNSTLDPVEHFDDEPKRLLPDADETKRELPSWVNEQLPHWGERICVPEWDHDENLDDEEGVSDSDKCGEDEIDGYRSKNGWKGTDLCHSRKSPVRISHYGVQYKEGGVGTTLTGVVEFTNNAESHAGFCHGGSMTSVMDDVIGWTAFHVTGACVPWSGFTAQVNVSLKRPIAVGSYLKVIGKIIKWEGRKVSIHAQLLVGEDNEGVDIVHCTAEGLVVLKRDVAGYK